MSYGNAVKQREEMIVEYERMLRSETNLSRKKDIEDVISQCQEEIAELKKGKPLFGRPKPLRQTTTIIEQDRENPSEQKVTIINPPQDEKPILSPPPVKRLGNSLRDKRKSLQTRVTEDSLKTQIQAAKAAKKG